MESDNRARTGLERFMDKFPYWPRIKEIEKQQDFEYLGVGAPMVDITQLPTFKKYKTL